MKVARAIVGISLCLSACGAEPAKGGSRIGGARTGNTGADQGNAGSLSPVPGLNGSVGNDGPVLMAAPKVPEKLPEGVCAQATVTASRMIPTVYLVIDGSSSMNAPFGGGTRWSVLREALVGANGVVTRLESVVKFGMTIYGNSNPMMCPMLVEVKPPALMNLAMMSGMYPQIAPGGGTPTGEALQGVVDGLPDFTQPTLDGPQERRRSSSSRRMANRMAATKRSRRY
jgi:hypothetical protein